MFKVRVISAAVGLALLAAVMLLTGEVLGIGVFVLSLMAMREFYMAVLKAGFKPIRVLGYLSCIPILYLAFSRYFVQGIDGNLAINPEFFSLLPALGVFVFLLAAGSVMVFFYGKYTVVDLSLTAFGILYVAFLFSFVVLTRNLENGHFYIWMVFIGAWGTDTFAYFTGKWAGKRRVAPVLSPKKTLEGCIGGIIGCTGMMLLYGIFTGPQAGGIPLYHYGILGMLCGVISQLGDLTASAVKRYVGIKDYGSVMPGHGGVLDRFDSILFTAPAVYFYALIWM